VPSESAIRALIDADPSDPFGWYALGIELRRLSQFSEAREAFHASLQRDENQPYAWFQIAQILAEEGQQSEAVAAAREGLQRANSMGDPQASGELGGLLEQLEGGL
jgi:uncharacterized protein HemY